MSWFHTLLHFFGVEPRSPSTAYNWWSGAGSDIGELTLLGLFIGAWHHVNCHASGCWRVGRHPVDGTPYKVCRRHHPTVPDGGATFEDIVDAHLKAQGSS